MQSPFPAHRPAAGNSLMYAQTTT